MPSPDYSEKFRGAKYNSNLRTPQIAALIRADIKAAKASGALPNSLKVSVRSASFSMGSSIDVEIQQINIRILNPDRVFREFSKPYDPPPPLYSCPRCTPQAEALRAALERIVCAYLRDCSDLQSDYYNVSFYHDVKFASELENQERAILKELWELNGRPSEAPRQPSNVVVLRGKR